MILQFFMILKLGVMILKLDVFTKIDQDRWMTNNRCIRSDPSIYKMA